MLLVTHTQDAHGNQRLYLGVRSSLECYLEPTDGDTPWQFRLAEAATAFPMSADQQRAIAQGLLLDLAHTLDVAPADLKDVPFETIAALHSPNPMDARRVATPKRHSLDHGFMATPPDIRRPQGDFSARDYRGSRRQR